MQIDRKNSVRSGIVWTIDDMTALKVFSPEPIAAERMSNRRPREPDRRLEGAVF